MFKNVIIYPNPYIKDIYHYCDNKKDYFNFLRNYPAMSEIIGDIDKNIKPVFDVDALGQDIDIQETKKEINQIFPNKKIYYAKREPREHKNSIKYSYRFYVSGVKINYKNLLKLCIHYKLFDIKICDNKKYDNIYTKNRLLLLPLTTEKYENKKVPELKVIEGDIFDCCASYIEEDYEDWNNIEILKDIKLFEEKEKKTNINDDLFSKSLSLNKNYGYDEDLILARKLVMNCLSYNRAENYEDWIKLGFCLRTIDYRLLDTWIEFSKFSNSYFEGECQKLWDKFKENGNISIGSLKYWAKNDNKQLYEKIIDDTLTPWIDKAIRSEGAHLDVANVTYEIYKNKMYYDVKTKCWFKVNEKTNIWFQDDSAGTRIRIVLGEDVCKKFIERTQYWNSLQSDDELQVEANKIKAKMSLKIASQLKNAGFRDSIMKEMKGVFATDNFKSHYLNKKYHLFAFKNCVFDCITKEFRDIEPNDYIMKTTKYDFDYDTVSDDYIEKVENIFKDILNTPEKYQYFIDINSLRLFGRNVHQEFYIFTGIGSNGKSLWYALHKHAMGSYCDKLNPETFTKQSKTSNQTSELSSVEDCRSCIIEEPNDEEKLINKTLKEISGGTYKARGLFEEAEEKQAQFALIFLCNDIPDLQKSEEAIARRVRVVSFDNKYCDNPVLPNERVKDLSLTALFSEDINYARAYIKILIKNWINKDLTKTLITPQEIKGSSKKYLDDSNMVKNFIEMYYDKSPNDTDKIRTVNIFNDYCCRIGRITSKALVKEMKNLGFEHYKSMGNMYFKNIKQKNEEFLEDD